jgi:hypothetical protein
MTVSTLHHRGTRCHRRFAGGPSVSISSIENLVSRGFWCRAKYVLLSRRFSLSPLLRN